MNVITEIIIYKGDDMRNLYDSWVKASEIHQSDKNTCHSYLEIYQNLFQNKNRVNLLEIGIKRAGSLVMWADFFDEGSVMDGIDLKLPKTKDMLPKNVYCFSGNAYSEEMVEKFRLVKYDIIIDDGSHYLKDMIFVVQNYLPLLKSDGILVIEDVKAKFLKNEKLIYSLLNVIPNELKICSYIIDRRFVKKRSDDVLLVINKEMLNEKSNGIAFELEKTSKSKNDSGINP